MPQYSIGLAMSGRFPRWRQLVDRLTRGRRHREALLVEAVGARRAAIRGGVAGTAVSRRFAQGRLDNADFHSDAWAVECLAHASEAATNSLGLDPDPVQILAALHLRRGRIVEMATGEGKTLVAALAACLGARAGRRVHVVTANDYLARRDSEWMSQLYGSLELTAACRQRGQSSDDRRAAYERGIVYGTAAEFGFDYLIDGLRRHADSRVCHGFDMAIVDEIDHILLDEAANPLVVTADVLADAAVCSAADMFAANATEEHRGFDRERREVWLSDMGMAFAERWLTDRALLRDGGLYDLPNLGLANRIAQALRARWVMARDMDYIVQEGKILVLDTRTGRPTRGRFPDGLQQALEVREGVALTPEQRPVAALSLRSFAGLYDHCCGMTGTAAGDADEFAEVYGLDVVQVPRAVAARRIDHEDQVYQIEAEKLAAMLELVVERHERGQPILVGTTDIQKSESFAAALTARGLPHQVLHAHVLEQEATIVARAGRKNAITIATKMAGRGTDIVLGSEDADERDIVAASGGLLVIGAERQRLRRLDAQLRGRAGRRGDPGEAIFFASLEDELFRQARGSELEALEARSAGGGEGRLLDARISRLIATLQAGNRAADAAGRRSVRAYDEVLDRQWRLFQELRDSLLLPERPQTADMARVMDAAGAFTGVDALLAEKATARPFTDMIGLALRLVATLDACWQEHMLWLGELRHGIGWRAVGGGDPLLEYRKEAFIAFENALDRARRAGAAAFVAGA